MEKRDAAISWKSVTERCASRPLPIARNISSSDITKAARGRSRDDLMSEIFKLDEKR